MSSFPAGLWVLSVSWGLSACVVAGGEPHAERQADVRDAGNRFDVRDGAVHLVDAGLSPSTASELAQDSGSGGLDAALNTAHWGDAASVVNEVPGDASPPPLDAAITDAGAPSTSIHPARVDLLFVVDNSRSMSTKQELLADAVTYLAARFASPPCIAEKVGSDLSAAFNAEPANASSTCPEGQSRAFGPIVDLHVGIITSSLGPRGLLPEEMPPEFNCDAKPMHDDHAWLLGRARTELNEGTYQAWGFLAWDPQARTLPPGDAELSAVLDKFTTQLAAAGERGCGHEAPLEAAYRFLIEPEPYQTVARGPCPGQKAGSDCAYPAGLDEDLLGQRRAFLRPDSLLAVSYLTDENDCSLRTIGQGYLAMAPAALPRASNTCDRDPNDPCCVPCGYPTPPDADCPDDIEAGCDEPTTDAPEAANVRCFDQKRRFGVDLLRSTDVYAGGYLFEYVQGPDRDPVANPLFTEGRGREQIFVLGLVGTPWQDTAAPSTLARERGLELAPSSELDWSLFLGESGPRDPFNAESISPRSGKNPQTGEELTNADAWNDINGHERPLAPNDGIDDDLQYACIFPLFAPRDCATEDADSYCDCLPDDPDGVGQASVVGNPLCWDGEDYTTTQYFNKATPAPRMFDVLHQVACPPDASDDEPCNDRVVLSSICPRQLDELDEDDFGYRPAMRALLASMTAQLRERTSEPSAP